MNMNVLALKPGDIIVSDTRTKWANADVGSRKTVEIEQGVTVLVMSVEPTEGNDVRVYGLALGMAIAGITNVENWDSLFTKIGGPDGS